MLKFPTQRPSQLEVDLMTLIQRLEQIDAELRPEHWLWSDRVMACDVVRLRSYVSPEFQAWIDEYGDAG